MVRAVGQQEAATRERGQARAGREGRPERGTAVAAVARDAGAGDALYDPVRPHAPDGA